MAAILLAVFESLYRSVNGGILPCKVDDGWGREDPVAREEESLLFNNGVETVRLEGRGRTLCSGSLLRPRAEVNGSSSVADMEGVMTAGE